MKDRAVPDDDGDLMAGLERRRARIATLEPGERPEWSRKALLAFHGFLLLVFIGGGWLVFGQLRAEPSPAPVEGVASSQDREGVVAGVPSPTLTPSPARSQRADSVPLVLAGV